MATQTRTRRASSAGRGRYARGTSTPRRTSPVPGLRRRRPPQQSGLKNVMSSVLPAAAVKRATPGSKKGKAGGLALVAAAAGMAFKNRGRLGELRRRNDTSDAPADTGNASVVTPPSTPAV